MHRLSLGHVSGKNQVGAEFRLLLGRSLRIVVRGAGVPTGDLYFARVDGPKIDRAATVLMPGAGLVWLHLEVPMGTKRQSSCRTPNSPAPSRDG